MTDGDGGGAKGQGRRPDKVPAEDRGGTPEGIGEGQSPRVVGVRARPSIFFDYATYAKRGGRRSAGSESPDCVKARRAAAALALVLTVATLPSLFQDVLRLL